MLTIFTWTSDVRIRSYFSKPEEVREHKILGYTASEIAHEFFENLLSPDIHSYNESQRDALFLKFI